VREGARDTKWNGSPVLYQPSGPRTEEGVRTIVRGRARTCPLPPIGPPLNVQGAITRMCIFLRGYVTSPHVVPARNMRELRVLRDAARAAVLSGDASEWALVSFRARGRVRWGIHLRALPAVVRDLADRVAAPWTLDIEEKRHGTWVKGAQIFCRDGEGRAIATLEADSVFDDAVLPPFAAKLRALVDGGAARVRPEGGGVVDVPRERPTGEGAWEKWVKGDEKA
jgi:hypothetical protein